MRKIDQSSLGKSSEPNITKVNPEQIKKVLIINGSPHLDKGATGIVLDAFERGIQKSCPEIEKKLVYTLDIKPCRGCLSCWASTPGKCIQKDDMESILPLVSEADLLIIATPVYVDGMTGPMKTFLDRLIPLIKGRVELRDDHMRHVQRRVTKGKMVLVSVSGFSELDNFDPLVAHVRAAAKNLSREYYGEILVPSAWFLPNIKPVFDRVAELIVTAGEELMEGVEIPRSVSTEIASLMPREHVVAALNRYYGQYE